MNVVGLAFVGAGIFFLLVTAVGLIRLPGFFTRVHAVSKSETMGIALILVGLMIHEGVSLVSIKFGLIVVFVAIANPAGAHLLTRAAIRTGIMPWSRGGPPERPETETTQ